MFDKATLSRLVCEEPSQAKFELRESRFSGVITECELGSVCLRSNSVSAGLWSGKPSQLCNNDLTLSTLAQAWIKPKGDAIAIG